MAAQQPLVMVVEDEPDIATMLETQLTFHGYRVIIANPGHNTLLTRDFWTWVDVAVIDAMMPLIPGQEVLMFLASHLPQIRRVLCTASLLSVREYGHLADAIVTKPYTLPELLEAVGGEE